MSNAPTTNANDEFDFSFGNFRAMGFQYTGIVKQCRVEQPREATFTFVDKRTGESVTRPAKPQLVMLIQPTDHATKSGNPYPEYFPLTQNIRSKLGIFVEHLQKLGLDLGKNPSALEGKEFQWEVKEVSFGGTEPVRVTVPVAFVDALTTTTKAAAPSAAPAATGGAKFDDATLDDLAALLDGKAKTGALAAVAASSFSGSPKVVAGIADGSIIRLLISSGRLAEDNGSFTAVAA